MISKLAQNNSAYEMILCKTGIAFQVSENKFLAVKCCWPKYKFGKHARTKYGLKPVNPNFDIYEEM